MLTIACVLKSGGEYDWEYVVRLYEHVKEYITYEFEFVCLTDMKWCIKVGENEQLKDIRILELESPLKSYWAKLELFRLKGEVIYFDLDTIILKNLNPLVEGMRIITQFTKKVNNFFMMKAFNRHRRYASGVMAWTGNYEYIYKQIVDYPIDSYGKWEQDYIVDRLCIEKEKIHFVDDCLGGGIVSYKHHCQGGIPESANIICFHGKPRPREVNWLEGEMADAK